MSDTPLMGVAVIVIVGAVVASMIVALYAYSEYQPNHILGVAGQTVRVGPVEYSVTFEGTSQGSRENRPENTYVRIGITAENVGDATTNLSGGQFLINDGNRNHEAVYGQFSEADLLFEKIEPGEPVQRTTQFDIEFDEQKRYDIIIRPQKEQSTVDTATICILNC